MDFVGFSTCFSAIFPRRSRRTVTVVVNPIISIYHTSQLRTSAPLNYPLRSQVALRGSDGGVAVGMKAAAARNAAVA